MGMRTSLAGEERGSLLHPSDRHAAPPPCRNPRLRGLLVDFGGVLTTNVFASFEAFCRSEDLDPDHVKQLFRSDERARGLLEDLETGALSERDFEVGFAERL